MMTSYAGNFEDVLLSRIFRGVERGFYVDIGACHARLGSASYVFYERGWSGVNVEPGLLFDTLTEGRPRDINVRAVITDKDSEVEFFHRDNPATSTVSRNLAPEVEKHVKDRVEFTVPSLRMSTFVDRYIGDRHVHFLKVDAEGSEPGIFESCDWARFRPEVIVSEAVRPYTNIPVYDQWSHNLLSAGYKLTLFDGINAWFVREESHDLIPRASIPVNQLDYFFPFDLEKVHLMAELAALKARPPM
jgi:FkbM family methyltransferase